MITLNMLEQLLFSITVSMLTMLFLQSASTHNSLFKKGRKILENKMGVTYSSHEKAFDYAYNSQEIYDNQSNYDIVYSYEIDNSSDSTNAARSPLIEDGIDLFYEYSFDKPQANNTQNFIDHQNISSAQKYMVIKKEVIIVKKLENNHTPEKYNNSELIKNNNDTYDIKYLNGVVTDPKFNYEINFEILNSNQSLINVKNFTSKQNGQLQSMAVKQQIVIVNQSDFENLKDL